MSPKPNHAVGASPHEADAARPLRSDARRNRQKLVEVARDAFARAGEPIALENIAREAGVGIGTLYRHFPTRESLIEEVYAAELDDVVRKADTVLAHASPEVALIAWMEHYAGFVAAKRGLAEPLRAGLNTGTIVTASTRQRITGAVEKILSAGRTAGVLRHDVRADDLTAMLLGVFLATAAEGDSEQTMRLLQLVVDAVRIHHPGPSGVGRPNT
ncbi:TetR/AcrR family transcriptional regulator [Rathayibacter sp. YIM 133350]|uniref:TetR/AcrR family transcriptional regulator n=1 Tax=Rathayibacter sp. YIM 133350 TaxID=3131992 RepID=UPI00307CCC52